MKPFQPATRASPNMPAMAANGYTLDFQRGSSAATLEPAQERIDCDWSASSRVGRDLVRNADAWRAAPDDGFFVVADGLGGHNAGEVASQLVVDRIAGSLSRGDDDGCDVLEAGHEASAFEPDARWARSSARSHRAAHRPDRALLMDRLISAANAEILAAAARRPECLGMASTVACLWLDERRLCIGHVGNSRIYLLRGTRFVRLTRDHVASSAIESPADDRCADRAGMPATLSRALGAEPLVDVDVRQTDWYHGDRLLLCTDGLSAQVSDAQIADVMQGAANASECVDTLIAAAQAAGGHDSVTVVGVFLSRSFTAA